MNADIGQRLTRAKNNVDRLGAEIVGFVTNESTYTRAAYIDPDGNGRVYIRSVAPFPEHWGLLIGDIVTDLRFSLDYAAYELSVRGSGQNPPPRPRRIEFPVFLHEERFMACNDRGQPLPSSGLAKIEHVTGTARTIIERVQPYKPGNGGEPYWLWVLHELCNLNKHRFIPVSLNYLTRAVIDLTARDATVDWVEAQDVERFEPNAVIGLFHVTRNPDPSTPQIDIDIETATDVIFQLEDPTWGYQVRSTLTDMCKSVDALVKELDAALPIHGAPP